MPKQAFIDKIHNANINVPFLIFYHDCTFNMGMKIPYPVSSVVMVVSDWRKHLFIFYDISKRISSFCFDISEKNL
jgi:hypothetical protein